MNKFWKIFNEILEQDMKVEIAKSQNIKDVPELAEVLQETRETLAKKLDEKTLGITMDVIKDCMDMAMLFGSYTAMQAFLKSHTKIVKKCREALDNEV